MNWKQIHTSSIPEERLDGLYEMLKIIDAHKRRKVFVHGRLICERRRSQVAHFINDRRGTYQPFIGLYKLVFWTFMLVMTGTTWLTLWHSPAQGAPLLAAHLGVLLFAFLIKPYKIRLAL